WAITVLACRPGARGTTMRAGRLKGACHAARGTRSATEQNYYDLDCPPPGPRRHGGRPPPRPATAPPPPCRRPPPLPVRPPPRPPRGRRPDAGVQPEPGPRRLPQGRAGARPLPRLRENGALPPREQASPAPAGPTPDTRPR